MLLAGTFARSNYVIGTPWRWSLANEVAALKSTTATIGANDRSE
jgi:hypothetical protein